MSAEEALDVDLAALGSMNEPTPGRTTIAYRKMMPDKTVHKPQRLPKAPKILGRDCKNMEGPC